MARSTRGSRRPRSGLVFLLVGVLIAALLFAADQVAARLVENQVARQLQPEIGSAALPKVDIEGFPFVTQVLRRSFGSVHVEADDVRPPDEQQSLRHVDVRLHDVTSSDRYRTFTAGHVDGTATLDYANAQALSRQPIEYAREGRVALTVQTTLLALPVTAKVIGRPVVNATDQTLTLADPEINVAGVDVPDTTSQALLSTLLKPVPITGVPYGLSVTALTAQPDGLDATLTGQNVTFAR